MGNWQNLAMKLLSLILLTIFTLLTPSVLFANGGKRPPFSITFHLEANNAEGRKLSIPVDTKMGKKFIQKSPTFSTKDFIAYHTFVSPHPNEDYGVTLQLSKTAAKRLNYISAQNKGRYIVANINGAVADMIYIDKQVDGRVITIWRNVDPRFLKIVNPLLPKIGETRDVWKKRLKSEKKLKK